MVATNRPAMIPAGPNPRHIKMHITTVKVIHQAVIMARISNLVSLTDLQYWRDFELTWA